MVADSGEVLHHLARTRYLLLCLGASERAGSPPVTVINRHMAETYWGDRSPVGSRISVLGENVEVVGVVENPTWQTIGEAPSPFIFVAQQQFNTAATSFMTPA